MKKIKLLKVTVLFLLCLCAISGIVISIRHIYFYNKQEEIKAEVIKKIENKLDNKQDIFQDGMIGVIIIPSLGIEAPIYEGTSKEILKYTVGHFENTSLWNR